MIQTNATTIRIISHQYLRKPVPTNITICVGSGPGCVRTIQEGLARAHAGDIIRIERGTFAGGITIAKSVSLIGAGPGATIVKGGGPVITITPAAGRVSLAGLMITGGLTTRDPVGRCGADIPTCGPGYLRATALGGGIEIAPSTTDGPGKGATVTITDAVVSGNRAEPRTAVPSVTAKCPAGPCPFAQAGGGGIDNWGTLTLIRTCVTGNAAVFGLIVAGCRHGPLRFRWSVRDFHETGRSH